ncbi:MAG TPA: delta-60 repeat domain-containing protein, partial [Caldilineaceae bacterium]|nr:delta-60 repeat domain-containing protein [Caldilineaceae bacterium]
MQTIKSVLVPAFPRSLLLALLLLAMALLPVAAADGDLDPTFDSDGSVTTAIGSAGDVAYAVAIQDDGKIVVGGTYVNGTPNDDLFLARYNSDGSLDTTFDSDGIVTVSVAVGDDEGLDVALQSDGKILLAGLGKAAAGKNHFILFRYNSDGSLDTSFDSDG